jgi:hypothetical protein
MDHSAVMDIVIEVKSKHFYCNMNLVPEHLIVLFDIIYWITLDVKYD